MSSEIGTSIIKRTLDLANVSRWEADKYREAVLAKLDELLKEQQVTNDLLKTILTPEERGKLSA